MYPGNVGSFRQQPPDQLTQGGGPGGALALGHAEHSLVGGAERDEVPHWRGGTPLEETPEHQTALRYSYRIVTSGQVSVVLEYLAGLGYLHRTVLILAYLLLTLT